jgi:hypothetical protein
MQACSAKDVARATSAKFGLPIGNIKLNTQDEE